MRRGEVWWADLPKPLSRRPVLLLSRDAAYRVRRSITVAPLTRTVFGIASEVPLGPEDGLPSPCVANLDNLLTIPKRLLLHRLADVPPEKMRDVERAIRFALDLK